MTATGEWLELALGEQNKAELGCADAIAHLGASDCALIWKALRTCAGSGVPFTSDAVRFALPVGTSDRLRLAPNAMGAIFRLAAKQGLLERTGQSVPALHAGSRGRQLPLWRGVKP